MKYWDKSWSVIEGCDPVSPACDNCWLAKMDRFNCQHKYNCADCPHTQKCKCFTMRNFSHGRIEFTGKIVVHPERLNLPLKTKKNTIFAVWSDLFHEKVPINFIHTAFDIMGQCPRHTFLICTKRPHRIEEILYGSEGDFYMGGGDYLPNVFLGTTIENQDYVYRASDLTTIHTPNLFLSVEPMLSAITIPQEELKQFFCVIAGCESGPSARETKEEWVRDLRDQCLEADVPLWVKQLKANGKMVYNHHLSTINLEDLWKQ